MLAALVTRSKRDVVPFRIGFVRRTRDDATLPAPPLARTLRGGRGGEVRLKLFLSMNLIAVHTPHNVTRKAGYWAALLGLEDPETNGARRVNDGIKWLEVNKFIRTERRRGGPPEVFLRSQLGTGEDFTRPTPAERYINMPVNFWRNGWIVALSAPAVAMWLITQEMQGGKRSPDEVWISPAVAKERYDLSDDTRTKGTRELEEHGLLTIGRTKQGLEWTWDRLRNTYWLDLGRLDDQVGSVSRFLRAPHESRSSAARPSHGGLP
jgi:hypothetical protein